MADPKDDNKQDLSQKNADNQTEEIEVKNTVTEVESSDSDKSSDSENKVVKFMKSIIPTVVIAIGSFLLVFLLHYFGAFNTLELKLYDLRMKLRGPLSGTESNSALPQAAIAGSELLEGLVKKRRLDRTRASMVSKRVKDFWNGSHSLALRSLKRLSMRAEFSRYGYKCT